MALTSRTGDDLNCLLSQVKRTNAANAGMAMSDPILPSRSPSRKRQGPLLTLEFGRRARTRRNGAVAGSGLDAGLECMQRVTGNRR